MTDAPPVVNQRKRPPMQRQALAAMRQERALQLCAQGWTTPEIARELGYSHRMSAWSAIKAAIAKMPASEHVEEFREVEGARLDVAQAAIWNRVMEGDIQAINAYLRISERRAALFGLDQPRGLELSLKDRRIIIEPQTDWKAGLAALAPGPVGDRPESGEGKDAGNGPEVG